MVGQLNIRVLVFLIIAENNFGEFNRFTFLQRGSVKGLTLTAHAYHLDVHLRIS